MNPGTENLLFVFDADEKLKGVQLSAELWEKCSDFVVEQAEKLGDPASSTTAPAEEELPPEPMHEWDSLLQFWDFQYPVNYEVACDTCGQKTSDWTKDDPRSFRLISANLGGLVAFQCCGCKSKIIKKHFKDTIVTETKPYQESKQPKLNAVYG